MENQISKPITIETSRGELIDKSNLIKVKRMGNYTELSYIRTIPTTMPIERIDENTYRIKSTNQVKEYKRSKTRDEQIKSLKRTFKNLRELINTNFYGLPNEKFVTLTYAKHQRDNKQVGKHFEKWIEKVRKRYGKCDYINVVEPQASGSWHCHVLIKFHELYKENNYIDYNEFRSFWKHGSFVNVRDLTECHNVGLYLSAYLTDIEVNDETVNQAMQDMDNVVIEEKEVIDTNGNKMKKSFIKGGRLSYYPNKMNLYRCSRGIKQPTVYVGVREDIDTTNMELISSCKMELKKDNDVVNVIQYETYKNKHKKNLNQTGNLK